MQNLTASRQQGTHNWLSSVYTDDDAALASSAGSPLDDQRLAHAAVLCEEMRKAVFEHTSFKCSAGIAHNKVSVLYVLNNKGKY